MPKSNLPIAGVSEENILDKIYLIRGQKVMLDRDLAEMYGVPTFRLNEAVKRNIIRFPNDFMFQLTEVEFQSLISQIAISKKKEEVAQGNSVMLLPTKELPCYQVY